MKIYISGKITGKDPQSVAMAFNWTENQLLKQGYEVVNPLKLPHEHDKSWINYMREDIPHMINCDAIVMIDDWKTSNGAQLELDVAQRLGLKVFYQEKVMSPYLMPGVPPKTDIKESATGLEDQVFSKVCGLFGKTTETAKSFEGKRNRDFVMIRQISMTILHLRAGLSLTRIGEYFNRDHSTVNYSIKTVKNLLETDFDFRRDYGYLFDGLIFPNYK